VTELDLLDDLVLPRVDPSEHIELVLGSLGHHPNGTVPGGDGSGRRGAFEALIDRDIDRSLDLLGLRGDAIQDVIYTAGHPDRSECGDRAVAWMGTNVDGGDDLVGVRVDPIDRGRLVARHPQRAVAGGHVVGFSLDRELGLQLVP
jgi:hypothetical protein